MAEPWIKMRTDLSTNPKVVAIAEALNLDEDTVVGKMHRLWSWADKHANDGRAMGSPAWLDRMMKCKGLAAVLMRAEIDWLQVDDAWLVFPRWEEHNSQSAKSRAEAARRQRTSRENRTPVTESCDRTVTAVTDSANKSATRGEERRREKRTPAPAAQDQGDAKAGNGQWASGNGREPETRNPEPVQEQQQQATEIRGDQEHHPDIRPELLLAIQSTGATGPRPRELLARARPEDVLLIGALVREHKERVKREEGQGKTPVGPGALLNDIKRLLDGDKTTRTHADDKRRQYRKLDREKAERIQRNQSAHAAPSAAPR